MVKVHLIVQGRVQGVFFRSNTKAKADELRLSGYVKNMEDGNVEVVAEGPKDKLDELVEHCMHSPETAYVEDIDINYYDEEEGFENFEIRY